MEGCQKMHSRPALSRHACSIVKPDSTNAQLSAQAGSEVWVILPDLGMTGLHIDEILSWIGSGDVARQSRHNDDIARGPGVTQHQAVVGGREESGGT